MKKHSTDILEHVFNSGLTANIIIDRKRNILLFNRRAQEWIKIYFGTDLTVGETISGFLRPDDHPEFNQAFEEFESGETPLPVVNIIRVKGEERWYETIFTPIGDNAESLLLSISNITIRKQTFDQLSQSERRFKALMQHSPGITAVIDINGSISFISESVSSFMGFSALECRNRNIFTMVHNIDAKKFRSLIAELGKKKASSLSAEIQFIDKTGTSLFFDVNGSNQIDNPVVTGIILNMHDITERKYIDEMMRRIAHHNELILETANEGIFGVSNRDIITFINPYAASILGYRQEDLSGHSIHDFLGNDESFFSAFECSKTIHSEETIFTAKDGRKIPVEFSSNPIIDNGVCSGSVITFNDITRRKQIESELIAAKEEAEKANKAKSDFLAAMSHEIRTPMNSILGFLELMSMGQLDETQKEYLTIVSSNSRNLVSIINDILDISKIEKGKIELDSVTFDPVEKISHTIELFTAKALDKNISFDFIRTSVPRCSGDPLRLGQVTANLIGNAIKFTPKGGKITVKLSAKVESDSVLLEISVSDTGIGIPKDKHKAVFEAFTQSDPSIFRRFGGTGLGLSISSQIVSLMGGSLQVESTPGKGSRFFFTIKLLQAYENTENQETPGVQDSELPPDIHALIADDTTDSLKLLSLMLSKMGIKADLSVNGIEALNLFMKNPYDLVILDGNMPEMDGPETARRIREYETEQALPHTPIIALSARGLSGDKDEFINSGADTFVIKPVSMNSLSSAVGVILNKKIIMKKSDGKSESYIENLSESLGLLPSSIRELLSGFTGSIHEYISEIEKAGDPYDRSLLEQASHRLKGIAASYLLNDLADLCRRVEDSSREGRDEEARADAKMIPEEAHKAAAFLRKISDSL